MGRRGVTAYLGRRGWVHKAGRPTRWEGVGRRGVTAYLGRRGWVHKAGRPTRGAEVGRRGVTAYLGRRGWVHKAAQPTRWEGVGRHGVTAYLGGRVHEVELQQVLDAERLEEEDDVGEVRPLDLGDRRHQQLLLVLPVRVEPVALAARGAGARGRRS